MDSIERVKNTIRDVPDFPKEGITFKDITPVLQDGELFNICLEELEALVKDQTIDYIAGIEARGFIFGAALAAKMNCGFIPVRKKGKLPYKTYSESYALEYGSDTVEMHQDALVKGNRIFLIDDLLATGGTAQAAVRLIEKAGGNIKKIAFIVELGFLNGRKLLPGKEVTSLIAYN